MEGTRSGQHEALNPIDFSPKYRPAVSLLAKFCFGISCAFSLRERFSWLRNNYKAQSTTASRISRGLPKRNPREQSAKAWTMQSKKIWYYFESMFEFDESIFVNQTVAWLIVVNFLFILSIIIQSTIFEWFEDSSEFNKFWFQLYFIFIHVKKKFHLSPFTIWNINVLNLCFYL